MGGFSDRFFEMRAELARTAGASDRPLTFVLGAGASLTSGAPSTGEVHAALEAATSTRLNGDVRERLHEILDEEIRDQLGPLFADVVPNVGYRLLAAVGRVRRINIINLNWDDAAEKACAAAGVEFVAFDPNDEQTLAEAEARLPEGRGIIVVHVHGTLERRPRYSMLETLPHPAIWGAIEPLLAHVVIVCGASLGGDADVALAVNRARGARSATVWVFARGVADSGDLPSQWWKVISQDVDFDLLVIALAEEFWAFKKLPDARWDELVARPGLAHLRLPDADHLIELEPTVRRELVDCRVGALVARPHAGKTVGALRLAHLRLLMQAPDAVLRITFDLQDSVGALALAADDPNTIVFVDDPFGQIWPAENPRVVGFLRAIADLRQSWAYVSSRDSNWSRSAGRLQRNYPNLVVPTRHPGRWYEREDLLRLAEAAPRSERAVQLVHAGQAETPPEVDEARRRGRVLSPEDRVRDARSLMDGDDQLAMACVLLRMQELRTAPIPEGELTALIGADPATLDGVEALLFRYEIDRRPYWSFAHPTTRQVTDGYLLDHHKEVEERLLNAPIVPMWIRRNLDGWRLQQAVADLADVKFPVDVTPGDWLTERLATSPSDPLLREIAEMELDEWETMELAYVLVWVWDVVRALPAAELLLRTLLRRPMGCYAILEGCLYFQLGADDELWTRVAARLFELGRDPEAERERLLALDAVLWREPDNPNVKNWAKRAIGELDPGTAAFGFVRFASGYHGDGLPSLEAGRVLAADRSLRWDIDHAKLAAWLMAWHFAHQSRARAMLHRYDHHDKQWLCQSTFTGTPSDCYDSALDLAECLIAFPETAGWGFHLLCNLHSVTGLDLREARAAELAQAALERAHARDAGVVSAVLAYEPADIFRTEVQERIRRLNERNVYLDALANGVAIDEWLHVGPPRFRYIHDPAGVLETIAPPTDRIDPVLVGIPPAVLAENLWRAAAVEMADADLSERRAVARHIGFVERGDLRPLRAVARLEMDARAAKDPYTAAIRRWRGSASGMDGTLPV